MNSVRWQGNFEGEHKVVILYGQIILMKDKNVANRGVNKKNFFQLRKFASGMEGVIMLSTELEQRELNTHQIRSLSKRFNVSPEVFL